MRAFSVRTRPAFTLIELLVSVAVLTMLIGILIPSLASARDTAKAGVCKTRLSGFGKGFAIYANENDGVLVPGRMPRVDQQNWRVYIAGGLKYRPTFLAMLGASLGIAPFDSPAPNSRFHFPTKERGDRQNYTSDAYVCPSVPDWRDERNGCYGYNYQFLGNARLEDSSDSFSFKNWPVVLSRVRAPGNVVAVGDSLGTAAQFQPLLRMDYEDDDGMDEASGRSLQAVGNEGFNLDPPRLDPENGEMAAFDDAARSAVDTRHRGFGNILWLDGHASAESLAALGYVINEDAQGDDPYITYEGSNIKWTPKQRDYAWTRPLP